VAVSQVSGLRHAPSAFEKASASVSGYRAAFLVSAGLMLVGAILLSVLISSSDARVDQVGVPAPMGIDA
jgi:hypothetical protein